MRSVPLKYLCISVTYSGEWFVLKKPSCFVLCLKVEWNKPSVIRFSEDYHSRSALWNLTCKDYKDRNIDFADFHNNVSDMIWIACAHTRENRPPVVVSSGKGFAGSPFIFRELVLCLWKGGGGYFFSISGRTRPDKSSKSWGDIIVAITKLHASRSEQNRTTL
jgi:hypothetical protein